MFKNSKLYSFPLVAVAFVAACGGHVESSISGTEETGPDFLLSGPGNQGTTSIIFTNSLEPEALLPTDLGLRPLSSMSAATATSVRGPNGALLRQLLKYAVGCALDSHDRFQFVWVDDDGQSHHEAYWGHLGLAPNWQAQALNLSEQEWVTACLAARTNWYGHETRISMRGNNPQLIATNEDFNGYPVREGAFWGNLFSSTPYVRACFDAANVLYARDKGRECAAGHLDEMGNVNECGIIHIVGSCDEACAPASAEGYYSSCRAFRDDLSPEARTSRIITVFLR